MPEAADHADKSTPDHGPRRSVAPEGGSLGVMPAMPPLLSLQGKAGNAAIARYIERGPNAAGRVHPGVRVHAPSGTTTATIRREPNASMPPPNQSVAPTKKDLQNNGLQYQGETIFPDSVQCLALLRRLLVTKGASVASSWGNSMTKADNVQKASWSLFADEDYVTRTQAAMSAAVTSFDEENRIYMEKFEMTASNTTDALLTNAEEQILAEQKKLGMSSYQFDMDSGTVHSAKNTDYLQAAKRAAADLAKRRSLADFRAEKADEARKKAQAAQAAVPTGLQNQFGEPSTAPVQTSFGTISPILSDQQLTHKAWREAEDDFKAKAQEATKQYPSIAPMATVGKNTAEQLKTFSEANDATSAQSLGEQFSTKLANIHKVKSEFGKRFVVWKQPALLSMTHEQMQSTPGQRKMVSDKAHEVKAEEQDTKDMYAAIALGLGLLAAIPTGGTSLAGVAAAAAVSSAAFSAYTAYEGAQEYLLQSASANTQLDRANEISKDDPSFLPVAIDICAAILDLGAAKAAFLTLKETIAAAKMAKSAEKLPELINQMRRAHITPGTQAKVIAEVLPSGGDVNVALKQIKDVFAKTSATAVDKELAEMMQKVAQKAIDNGKVIIVPGNPAEAEKFIRAGLQRNGFKGEALADEAKSVMDTMFGAGKKTNGIYDPPSKLIYVRGDTTAEGAASLLIHEATHLGQDTRKTMNAMGIFQSEFEAYKAQQQFLQMLPYDKVPDDFIWLLKADEQAISKHVRDRYGVAMELVPNEKVADSIFRTLFMAEGGAKK